MPQQAVTKGKGKKEYFRPQLMILLSFEVITPLPKIVSSPIFSSLLPVQRATRLGVLPRLWCAAVIVGLRLPLPTPRMHLEVRVLAEAVELHQGPTPTVGLERVALLSATVPARLPARDNAGLERFW